METMEYERGFGAVLSPHDSRDYQAKDYITMGVRPLSYFPDFEIPVLDQGSVGSCVAHALATLKYCQEHRERKSNNSSVSPRKELRRRCRLQPP